MRKAERIASRIVADELRDGNYFYCGEYYDASGLYREIAHGLKRGDDSAIEIASKQMAKMIPPNSILVPVPSHTGNADCTLKLANAIAKITGSDVVDALKGKSRRSLYEMKKNGEKIDSDYLGFYLDRPIESGKNVIFVDNVIATGTTANAALATVDTGSVIAYAFDSSSFLKKKAITGSVEGMESEFLYHATYKPLLDSIRRTGLGGTKNTWWEDSIPGVVYLADDPDIAESYAEANESVDDEWLDEIVVFEVNVSDIDASKLYVDENVRSDEPPHTYEYHGTIPYALLKVVR